MGTVFNRSPKTPARKRASGLQSLSSTPNASSLVPSADSYDLAYAVKNYSSNETIFSEGETAEYFYKLETGCIRTCNTLGATLGSQRRQIGAFYFPGDFFGLDAQKVHNISAETIRPSTVHLYKRKMLKSRAHGDATAKQMLDHTVEELQRVKNHNLLLLMSAENRVIVFLLDMARRSQNQNDFELPMSRRDIADYLGLTIETVSRMFTRLENISLISLPTPWRIIVHNQLLLN